MITFSTPKSDGLAPQLFERRWTDAMQLVLVARSAFVPRRASAWASRRIPFAVAQLCESARARNRSAK